MNDKCQFEQRLPSRLHYTDCESFHQGCDLVCHQQYNPDCLYMVKGIMHQDKYKEVLKKMVGPSGKIMNSD